MRRQWIRVAVVATLLWAATSAAHSGDGSTARAASVADDRPNVLIIMTDDQRRDDMRWMPRTRRLIGDQGVTYTKAVSENPLCCPARAALLTGRYSHNNGVIGNHERWGGGFLAFPQNETINLALAESGYNTGWLGKFVNGYQHDAPSKRYIPPGWSQWHAPVRRIRDYRNWQMNHNGTLRWDSGHRTDVYARQSSRMIGRLAAEPEPFYAVVSYYAPHGGEPTLRKDKLKYEPIPAPRHEGDLRGKLPRWPRSFNERDVSDKPDYIRQERPWPQVRALRRTWRARAESLLSADEAVARNIAALRQAGELDDTIVVFTSDNGFLLGEHRKIRKTFPHEESLGVPLMIRGPGFERGGTVTSPVGLIDVATTAAHAGGVDTEMPYDLDGRDLAGERTLPRRPVLIEAGRLEDLVPPTGSFSYQGVRTPRYTYVKYMTGEEELYDNRVDRWQLRSRHDDAGYADVLTRLRGKTERLRDCSGDDCRE